MKTLHELQKRIGNFLPSGHGHFKFKVYTKDSYAWYTTSNTRAIDRINSDLPSRANYLGYTEKQAYMALYNNIHN